LVVGKKKNSDDEDNLKSGIGVFFAAMIVLTCATIVADDERPRTDDEKEQTIRTVNIPGFAVIGIQARTNNAKEATADGIIGRQWHKFIDEGISKIPDKSSSNLYAVYTEYASDHNGDYTFMVGAPVKLGTAAPAGMVLRVIPAGKYAVITTAKGAFPKVIPEAWMRIFKLEDEGKLKRTYRTDFELYDERTLDPQNGEVDIYVGVK
jgi:predicted transcriptional regulator YdeE